MANLIKFREGEASFVRWIKRRIEQNKNFLSITKGSTGVGKSYANLSMAYELDNDFEIRQVAFSFKEFMEILNSDWFAKKKWKQIIFEELQISAYNRNWQSLTNKLINYLFTTFRNQNVILYINTPYEDFLDSQTLKLIHAIFDCRGINRKENVQIVRPSILQYNSRMKKTYYHCLRVIRNGRTRKLKKWEISKPPKELIKPYEVKKTAFVNNLKASIERQINKLNEREEEQPKSEFEGKKQLLKEHIGVLDCWKQGIFSQTEIAKMLNKSQGAISRNELSMRKRGYMKEEYSCL